jgi:hypothetical protein
MVDNNKISPAFMMLLNPSGYNSFLPAPYYISEKLNEYIKTNRVGKVEYTIIPEEDDKYKTIHVTINNFDSVAAGLSGEYHDFYECCITVLICFNIRSALIREKKEFNYISLNEDKLRNFCGYINRLTN